MTGMEPQEIEVDNLLRRSMAAPVPNLPPDFERRVMCKLNQSSPELDRYRRIVLASYALISVAVSAVVMRSQGLEWGAIAAMILGPLALIVAVPLARRAAHTRDQHSAK